MTDDYVTLVGVLIQCMWGWQTGLINISKTSQIGWEHHTHLCLGRS